MDTPDGAQAPTSPPPASALLDDLPPALAAVVTSPGWELLERLEAAPTLRDADRDLLSRQLRAGGIAPDTVSAVLTQLDLRAHAEAKFDRFARQMIFTRDGLEQATRLRVAALHAQRFRNGGATHVADLGCGIGGDALAMAGLGLKVTAFDRDPSAAACAAVNLRAFDDADVRLGDVTELDPAELAADDDVDAIFADPARRTGAARGGRRVLSPDQWSPPLATVIAWRDAVPRLGVKVAPGIAHEDLPADFHAQWVSVDGALVEASLWSPPLAPEGPGRSALVLTADGTAHTLTDPDVDAANAPVRQASVSQPGTHLLEPDPAVIRAGLIAHLAEELQAHLISPDIAYLTCDAAPDSTPGSATSPFFTRFDVIDTVPMRAKQIAAALRSHDLAATEVKKRGADIDPAALLKSLPRDGAHPAVVFATRVDGRHRAIIATRHTAAAPEGAPTH